jgi:hypothetical protein
MQLSLPPNKLPAVTQRCPFRLGIVDAQPRASIPVSRLPNSDRRAVLPRFMLGQKAIEQSQGDAGNCDAPATRCADKPEARYGVSGADLVRFRNFCALSRPWRWRRTR